MILSLLLYKLNKMIINHSDVASMNNLRTTVLWHWKKSCPLYVYLNNCTKSETTRILFRIVF